jgi:hypothetical protein
MGIPPLNEVTVERASPETPVAQMVAVAVLSDFNWMALAALLIFTRADVAFVRFMVLLELTGPIKLMLPPPVVVMVISPGAPTPPIRICSVPVGFSAITPVVPVIVDV